MINPILIHNDNVSESVKQEFESQNIIDFDYLNSEFNKLDIYISKIVIQDLKIKDFNIIFIKDNLSSNYLELYGIRVAYHIRLSQELDEKKRFAPIVLLSDLNAYSLNKLEPMARITFSKNIYVEPNSLSTIKKYNEKIEKNNFPPFNITNYKKNFLDLISIESPENSTNHSIANEWAIYKWAKELNINSTNSIEAIIQKLIHSLYFKYLKSIQNIEETIEIKSPKFKKVGSKDFKPLISRNTKILYIDDEWDKGWKEVLEQYFSQSLEKPLETIKYNFTNKTYEDVEQFIIEYINNYHPDLIILDMRLLQIDHNESTEVQNISGIRLLNEIKNISQKSKINPGIQVIMFSATSKSIILDEATKDNKIIGYIKKDSPEETILSTKENILRFTKYIEESGKKYFLKDIWTIQKEILDLKIFETDKYNEIKLEVLSIFEILNRDMNNKFNYSMFAVFKVLESLVNLYIEEKVENKKRYAYWINTNDKIPCVNDNNFIVETQTSDSNDRTENKIRVLLHEKLNLKDKVIHDSISNIVIHRNNTIHPKRNNTKISICEEHILEWFKMLKIILQKIEEKES